MAVFQNNLLAGAGAQSSDSTHTIDQSIRFNDDDSAYMSRTLSASNRKTFTFSCWVKRGNLSSYQRIFNAYDSSDDEHLIFRDTDVLHFYSGDASADVKTNQVFRDPSAWYHIVCTVDTTNAVSSERVRLYVNGSRVTSLATATYPSLNADTGFNENVAHHIGVSSASSQYLDGYLAEIVFIDGQALDPSSFGETNSSGIWIPKDVSGLTFGTNGFHIDGRDASDLGDDESGQGNDFTTSGLAAHDQVLDSPTNNFATLNGVYADASGRGRGTLANGNLQVTGSSSGFNIDASTISLPKSGKWYFEYTIGGLYDGFGFCIVGQEGSISASNGLGQLSASQGGGIQYQGWIQGAAYTVNFGSTFTAGHIHQVAIDVDNGKFYYGIQNTYYAADAGTDGNPSAGTNHTDTFDFSSNDISLLTMTSNSSGSQHWNFGQNGAFNGQKTAQGNSDANGVGNFYYGVPTGYLALCTKNLGAE